MNTTVVLALLMAILGLASSRPKRYDQRQDGDLNVHAHLENIVIVYVSKGSGPGLKLLNLVTKKAAEKYYQGKDAAEEGEGKTSVVIADSPDDSVEVEFKAALDPESPAEKVDPLDAEEDENILTTTPKSETLSEDNHQNKEDLKVSSPEEESTDKPSKEEGSKEKSSEENSTDEKSSEEKNSSEKSSEEKNSSEKSSEEKNSSDKSSEENNSSEKSSEDNSTEKSSEEKNSSEKSSDNSTEKSSEEKNSSDKSSEESSSEKPPAEELAVKEEEPKKKLKESRVLDRTDEKGLKLKQILAEGVEPCSRVTEQGLCLPVTRDAKHRIERQQRQRLIDIISTGISPAN